jgi:cell division protein FtsQ
LPRRQRRKGKAEDGPRLRLPVRLRYLLAGAAVAAGGVALAGQLDSARAWLDRQFPVTGVAVTGELAREAPEPMARWLAGQLDGGFFTADLNRLRRLVEARPWVREARLRRRWPGTLVVALREHRASARWRAGPAADWALVSRAGAVFRPRTLPAEGALPRLQGPRARLEELRARRAELAGRLGDGHRVSRVTVDARGDWTALVDGRVRVHFGRDHWRRRLARLKAVADGWRLLERRVARIDLRYPDGLAVALPKGADGPEGGGSQGSGGQAGPNTGGSPAGRPG